LDIGHQNGKQQNRSNNQLGAIGAVNLCKKAKSKVQLSAATDKRVEKAHTAMGSAWVALCDYASPD
jgi:hypothetical protein